MANEKIFPDLSSGGNGFIFVGADNVIYVSGGAGSGQPAFAHAIMDDELISDETSYSLVPNPGEALAAARADHTHGTPDLPPIPPAAIEVIQMFLDPDEPRGDNPPLAYWKSWGITPTLGQPGDFLLVS